MDLAGRYAILRVCFCSLLRVTLLNVTDCEQFVLNLDVSPNDIRQKTLKYLVEFLNKITLETDASRVAAVCLIWAANADIYERLNMAMHRNWKATAVIEGAPTASHWLGNKLQTAVDTKEIEGTAETKKAVIRNARICIDAGDPYTLFKCLGMQYLP